MPKLSDFAGSPSAVLQARSWAASWQDVKPQPPLLITGPTGTGKTMLAHAIASEFGWELFEFNASDLRDEASVLRILQNAAGFGSLSGARRLVLVDDADALSGTADRGGASAIAAALKSSSQPVILTASDYYSKKLSAIRGLCSPLKLSRLRQPSIISLLKSEARKKGIALTDDEAGKIASSSAGDARAALLDLSARNFSATRDRESTAYEALSVIFSSGKYSEARKAAFSSEADHDMLKQWVSSNIPIAYSTPFEISEACHAVSRADVFDGRIGRLQYFGFLRYSTDLLSSGVALSRTTPKRGFIPFAFPEYIRALASSKGSRALRKSVLGKILRACHCSASQAQSYLQLARHSAKEAPEEARAIYGFDDDEMEFLAGSITAKAKPKKAAKRGK